MAKPKVSIITALYNHERFVEQAIESVLGQTFQDFEYIIWDDGSRDGGLDLARAYMRRFPGKIKCYTHEQKKNLGQEATRNEALKVASGDFVCLLDSDDYWLPHKLEREVELMESDKEIGLVYSPTQIYLHDMQRTLEPALGNLPSGKVFDSLVRGNFIYACGAMIRRSCLPSQKQDFSVVGAGPFETRYGAIGEYPLWLRIAHVWKVAATKEPAAVWRVHGSNTGSKRRIQARRELVDMVGRFLADAEYRDSHKTALLAAQEQYLYDLAVILAEEGGVEGRSEAKRLFKGLLEHSHAPEDIKRKSRFMLAGISLGAWFLWSVKFSKRLLLAVKNPQQALLVNSVEG